MIRRAALIVFLVCTQVGAAKVILKSGKTYEGKIVAETDGDILMRTQPENRPRMLPSAEILTVVRDPVVQEPRDPQRYTAVELRMVGSVSDSKNIDVSPAAGFSFSGNLRPHPLIEIGGGLDWLPALSGDLAVTDGVTVRRYERFYAWSGGFYGRLFPLYTQMKTIEPFLTAGYHWTRLVPKGSGDSLRGQGLEGGAGMHWPLKKDLYAVGQIVYRRVSLDGIQFQGSGGGLESPVFLGGLLFSAGLSYHF